jgi:hypothetical protein
MSPIVKGILILLSLAYIAGAGYVSYMVYSLVYNDNVWFANMFHMKTLLIVKSISAAFGTFIGFMSIPLFIAYYKTIVGLINREGLINLLPMVAFGRWIMWMFRFIL